MVKNMGKYNSLIDRIENIFDNLNIKFKSIDLDDDDINYIITFNVNKKIKHLNNIDGVLYFHNTDYSMNFLVLNVYNLDDKNNSIDTLDLYESVNDINSLLLNGSFLIEDNKHIFYKSSVNCGEGYYSLDEQLLNRQIDIFIGGLIKLFDILKAKDKDNE